MQEPQKAVFIINPKAGGKERKNLPHIIDNHLDKTKFSAKFILTQRAGHASEIAHEFVEEGVKIIVAVGGDGTINEVASSLIHSPTALGIIPIGSGNGLALHLGISKNIKKAVEQLNHSQIVEIDYGKANEIPFFCTCGVGFDAHISEEFAKSSKRGFVNYIKKTINAYFTYKPEEYQLIGENINLTTTAFLITFANASQWGNNAYIAPKANVTDGIMDIAILSKFPLYSAPKLAIELFAKKIDNNFYINVLKAKNITLIRQNSGAFHRDGEPYEESKKIDIQIINAGLKILMN